MPILALGISHRRAPVELLERLAFVAEDMPKAYRRLLDLEAVNEGVVLSTCNRVEVFAAVESYHSGFLDLKRFLCEAREVAPEELTEPLYSHYEDDAAEHLFEVASGIDSMVLGEPQILHQVRAAHRLADAEGAAGPLLSALFRGAVRTGKRARAETTIGASPSAFVEAGADLAERALGGLAARPVAVVGAGGMAELSAVHLRQRGAGPIRIVSRNVERARRLAARAGEGVEAAGLNMLAQSIAKADLVVSSTGAAGLVIGPDVVRKALRMDGRRPGDPGDGGRRLFLLDLAVPRDVDPAVKEIPGVRVADIDDLREALAWRDAGTDAEVERVRTIVAEEVARFATWRRASRLAPLIQALRDRGARIQAAELARIAPRLAGLDPRQREAVEALAAGIVAKLLHEPTVRLKELTGPGRGDAVARALAELFGLDYPPRA
jgi:glutamyl-tRNA reductase